MFVSAGLPSSFRAEPKAPTSGFDARQAIRACTKIVETFPEERSFRVFLADAYWFAGEREAAVRVLARAATRFGGFEFLGLGSFHFNADALALLKTLAETNDEAQAALGHLYKEGRDVPADTELANSLFRRSAEQGNAEGQFQVGWALWWAAQDDPGNPKATAWRSEAEPWLRKAAAQCHRGAREIIDDRYDKVGQNQKWRNQMLIKARRGDVVAQGLLGREYLSDLFGPSSDAHAYAWITIALERGSDEESLEYWQYFLTERMSDAEMAEAKALKAVLRFSLCVD